MKRCFGIAALALALALTAGCGDDDGDGAGGSGGNGGNGGGGGNECPALERTGTLAGSCVQAGLGCYETRGAMAVQIAAQNQDVCETTGGSWVTEPCPAAAGGGTGIPAASPLAVRCIRSTFLLFRTGADRRPPRAVSTSPGPSATGLRRLGIGAAVERPGADPGRFRRGWRRRRAGAAAFSIS